MLSTCVLEYNICLNYTHNEFNFVRKAIIDLINKVSRDKLLYPCANIAMVSMSLHLCNLAASVYTNAPYYASAFIRFTVQLMQCGKYQVRL